MIKWNILPVLGGEFGMVRDDIMFLGGDPNITGMVPSLIFLLENSGCQVLVDTSFGNPKDVEQMGLVVKREGTILERIRAAGIEPDSVEALLLTHTHWDHADNCALFKNAKVYCQKKDYEYALTEEAGYDTKLKNTLRMLGNRLVLLEGNADILPGIKTVFFGGHTPGSQMILVDIDDGKAVITGDDVMCFANVEKNIPVGLCVNPEGCRRALEFIRQHHGLLVLPSHDYRTLLFGTDHSRVKKQNNISKDQYS